RSRGSEAEIRVTDTGEGISAEILPLMFERFSQADASSTRKHGGLGLGLSIVKNLGELHGGTICAESEGSGRGSTFIIRLPPRPLTEPVEAPTLSRKASAEALSPRKKLVGLKVLVVDDQADARDLIHRFLVQCGATAALAASATEAQALVQSFRPDVIVSD